MIKKPEIIIFDWDGTLVDTNNVISGLFHETIKELRIKPIDEKKLIEYKYYSMNDSLKLIFGDYATQFKDVYLSKLKESKASSIPPIHGALNALQYLKNKNVQIFIVSNKHGDMLRSEITELGWNEYFSGIVGALDAAKGKPWRDPVDFALRNIDHANKTKWFIGDSIVY